MAPVMKRCASLGAAQYGRHDGRVHRPSRTLQGPHQIYSLSPAFPDIRSPSRTNTSALLTSNLQRTPASHRKVSSARHTEPVGRSLPLRMGREMCQLHLRPQKGFSADVVCLMVALRISSTTTARPCSRMLSSHTANHIALGTLPLFPDQKRKSPRKNGPPSPLHSNAVCGCSTQCGGRRGGVLSSSAGGPPRIEQDCHGSPGLDTRLPLCWK
jgi:hypothetical protein